MSKRAVACYTHAVDVAFRAQLCDIRYVCRRSVHVFLLLEWG
jgi:hypothetical protein